MEGQIAVMSKPRLIPIGKIDQRYVDLLMGDPNVRYYAERLAEAWLLAQAVLLDVEANETPLAVPVGKFRRGGHIEFLDRAEAKKAIRLLNGREGFPNPRLVEYCTTKRRPADYFEVRWGDPPPFDGCDYCEPICALLLGIHYGYSDKAIVEQVQHYMSTPRKPYTRKAITGLIQSARSQR